jgi:hypothetical protein
MKKSSVEFLKSQFIQNGKLTVTDFQQAKEMESQKDAKYNEMLEMLERVVKHELTPIVMRNQTKELIEEAKEI